MADGGRRARGSPVDTVGARSCCSPLSIAVARWRSCSGGTHPVPRSTSGPVAGARSTVGGGCCPQAASSVGVIAVDQEGAIALGEVSQRHGAPGSLEARLSRPGVLAGPAGSRALRARLEGRPDVERCSGVSRLMRRWVSHRAGR